MGSRFISWGIFVLLCLIWGSSFILMKVSRQGFTAGQIASLRIFSAGVVLLPFALFHFSKIPPRKLGWVAAAGITGNLVPAFLFAIAITRIDSSLAGILNSLTPLWVVTIAAVVFREHINRQKLTGIIVGFLGLCALTFSRQEVSFGHLGYSSLIVLAAFFYGLGVNLVSHKLKEVHPVHIASVSLAMLCIPSGLIAWKLGAFDLDYSSSVVQWSLINTLLLGIVGSAIATALFYMLVKNAGAIFASLIPYCMPIVAIMWGYLDGEIITWKTILCLLIILFGVYLANRKDTKKEAPLLKEEASL